MISENLKEKQYWVKHWTSLGLTIKQALIAVHQAQQPVSNGLDKNSSY